MNNRVARAFFATIISLQAICQVDVPPLKTEVRNAFIWGEDAPAGAISSSLKDPLTGAEIRTLKHNGIEVISRMGFEKLRPEDVSEFIAYFTTIVNNTQSELSVEQGRITVDDHFVSPLSMDSRAKAVKKQHSPEGTDALSLRDLHCFMDGYLSSGSSLSSQPTSSGTAVPPYSSSTVSGVIKDPRHYSLLCTADGCFPKGTIRYSIRVGGHEYIFTWNGRLLLNCGN